jgi:hypothetical protein
MMKREGSEAGTTYGPNDGRSLAVCFLDLSFIHSGATSVLRKREGNVERIVLQAINR